MDIIYQQQQGSGEQPVFYGEVMTGVSVNNLQLEKSPFFCCIFLPYLVQKKILFFYPVLS